MYKTCMILSMIITIAIIFYVNFSFLAYHYHYHYLYWDAFDKQEKRLITNQHQLYSFYMVTHL